MRLLYLIKLYGTDVMKKTICVFYLLAIQFCFFAEAKEFFTTWPVDVLVKVTPEASLPDNPQKRLSIRAAGGEYESAQIAVRSQQHIENVKITISDLTSPDGQVFSSNNIRIRLAGLIHLKVNSPTNRHEKILFQAPYDAPDMLYDKNEVELKPKVTRSFWLTFFIPEKTMSATYEGRIIVENQDNTVEFPISLEVLPFAIPSDRHLFLTNWMHW